MNIKSKKQDLQAPPMRIKKKKKCNFPKTQFNQTVKNSFNKNVPKVPTRVVIVQKTNSLEKLKVDNVVNRTANTTTANFKELLVPKKDDFSKKNDIADTPKSLQHK